MMGSDMVRSVAVLIQVDLTQMSIASQLVTYVKSGWNVELREEIVQ